MEQHVEFHHDHFLSNPFQLSVNPTVCSRSNMKWPLNTISVTTHTCRMTCSTHQWLWQPCQSYQHSKHPDVGQPGCRRCPASL